MDGLLIVALIAWAIAQARKRKKKPQTQTASITQQGDVNRHRAERRARMQKELEKRKAQLAQEKKTVSSIAPGEGEATAADLPLEGSFRGSMQASSSEGECLCDPELEHVREEEPEPESVYAGEIGREPLVDFSGRGIMQGVVMSEILARPARRARRR